MKEPSARFRSSTVITFEEIFSFRSVWMLFAILWVILFHQFPRWFPFLWDASLIGYGGVDIFLFASGLGCWFSLHKQPDAKAFLKKRAMKILPMQFVFIAIFCAYQQTLAPLNLAQITGNFTGMGFLFNLDRQFNWYLGGMWICYLLAPILIKVTYRAQSRPAKLLTLLLLILSSFAFFNQFSLVFFTRLPIFYMGMLAAQLSAQREGLTLKEIAALLVLMTVGFIALNFCMTRHADLLWPYGLWWYPFILITPGLILLISLAAGLIARTPLKPVIDLMGALGQHTFPLYLSHLFIFDIFAKLYAEKTFDNDLKHYLISLMLVAFLALLLEGVSCLVTRVLQGLSRR